MRFVGTSDFDLSVDRNRGSTYSISGTQFNGLSQAAVSETNCRRQRISFGEDYEQRHATRVHPRTHDHSTMGVATGTATVSTNFDVPATMETGASTLEVVANGIPSVPVSITVQ